MSDETQQRVVGGQDAQPGQFPYIGSLQYRNNLAHFCGCSILNAKTAITAAHCVDSKTVDVYQGRFGTNKRSEGGVINLPLQQILHPHFNRSHMWNDVAILKLAESFIFTELIQTIALPEVNSPDPKYVRLSGWGYTSQRLPENLQYIDLISMPWDECNIGMEKWHVDETQICTQPVPGNGACNGDSGGPLNNEKRELVGIVSWGWPCAIGEPDVYTRVYSFIYWIEYVVADEL